MAKYGSWGCREIRLSEAKKVVLIDLRLKFTYKN